MCCGKVKRGCSGISICSSKGNPRDNKGRWTVKMRLFLTKTSILFFLFTLFTGIIHAGPPKMPMVIYGEVIVDGKQVPKDTVLKVTLGRFDLSSQTTLTETEVSQYRMEIPAYDPEKTDKQGAKEGEEVRFISLANDSLSNISPIKWKTGSVVRQDIFIRTTVQKYAEILSASAKKDAGGKWTFKCNVKPLEQKGLEGASISYKVRWFLKKKQVGPDKEKEGQMGLVKEDILKDLRAAKESEIKYDGKLD